MPAQEVTVTFTIDPTAVITWGIIGIIAGALAGFLVRGRRFNWLTSLITGLAGALVGGFLFSLLRLEVPPALAGEITIRLIDILVAVVGAIIVLLLVGLLYGFRRRL